MLFGHLAISILEHRYLKVDLAPAIAGGVFPDVLDKTLCQVLRLTPSGRMFGHTLLALGVSTVVVGVMRGRRTGRSWAMGYLAHLMADASGFVPWLYPFVQHDFSQSEPGLLGILSLWLTDPVRMGMELALSAWAVGSYLDIPVCITEAQRKA
jgi:hypothetical protein